MKAPRLYLSGPISAAMPREVAENLRRFREAADALRAAGLAVDSPTDNGLPQSASWAEHMRADLRMLLDCDAIATLPGWEKSRGAKIEVQLGESLGMSVAPVEVWIASKAKAA